MTMFRVGEIVDITIKGARVVRHEQPADAPHVLLVTIPNCAGAIEIPAPPWNGITVEHVAPAEWPPRPGDVWRDRQGFLFFAVDCDSSIDMRGEGDSGVSSTYVLKNYSPLTLVYRRESDGGQS